MRLKAQRPEIGRSPGIHRAVLAAALTGGFRACSIAFDLRLRLDDRGLEETRSHGNVEGDRPLPSGADHVSCGDLQCNSCLRKSRQGLEIDRLDFNRRPFRRPGWVQIVQAFWVIQAA